MYNYKNSIVVLSLIVLFIISAMNNLVSGNKSEFNNLQSNEWTNVSFNGGLMNSSWPMFHHDTKHSGRSPYGPAGNWPLEKWKFKMEGGVISSPAIDKNGTLYIGANGDDCLFAINPDGTEKWRVNIGNAHSSPAIGNDGTIYCGSNHGTLYAIYSNGTQKWEAHIGAGWAFSSPLVDENNMIYCASTDSNVLSAIYPNGTIKWNFYAENRIYCSPVIGDDLTIYIGSNDGFLYAINQDGTMKWKYYCGGSLGVDEIAINDNGIIYCGASSGYLYALYPNGTLQWKVKTGWIKGSCPAIADDGTIYVGDQSYHRIYAIAPNGTIKWFFQTQDDILSSPAIDKNGIIYGCSYDGYIYAINPNGSLKWKFEAGKEGIESSPIIGEDGTIYIVGIFPPSGTQLTYSYFYAITLINDTAPSTPTITGTENGKVRRQYDYTIVSTDPEEDNISYYIDWGDGKTTDWIGPYNSGEKVIQSHIWLIRGTYDVKVKARDWHGMESDWGTLSVTMPYEPQFPFIQWLFERFPNAFPLLRYLLNF
jgi:outer membrane protein assembly factor BamB